MQDQLTQLEKDYGIEWREYRLADLFGNATRGRRLKSADRINGSLPFVTAGEANTGISAWIGNNVQVFAKNTITIDMFGSAKFRNYEYGADDHVAIVHTEHLPANTVIYITAAIHKSSHAGQFDYSRNFYASDADELIVQLPTITSNGQPALAVDFMEAFIATLKAERIATLKAYLKTTGLSDYKLTAGEQATLNKLDKVRFGMFRFSDLFESIVQGRRLKKQDQMPGNLPFVMSGVTNTGVVDFIGNDVRVFPANSLTVDIFGNVFYRDYQYGMGDDTGAFWNTDNGIPKNAMLYIATVMQKFLSGKFDYGHKLRSSRTYDFEISLPVKPNKAPDYEFMEYFISAMQKVVIQNVVDFADQQIVSHQQVI